MSRIIGLDFGAMTCGVAISDELLITAQPKETIRRTHETKLRKTLARIEELITEYGVDKIVLGLPKKLDNTEGERAEKCREFAAALERRTGLSVILWDERLTTVAAHKTMNFLDVNKHKKKNIVDTISAVYILETYLNKLKNILKNN